ncbi:hypothetical protein LOTGIDRAFT_174465 [Lottia gigantea]|uniref:DUF3504 domain-containing protein n=1 Tax=Lottia gigantea TaxID=225164 RepID=V4ALN1_LOTGI|nr:hypothetical protein LOTGIDRAFT_174465 [Lottia gigantea]ESO98027.1 hypothetical protein LOTGIDRAFT_174465 [Lottia gigantea]
MCVLQSALKANGSPLNIFEDRDFLQTKTPLDAVMKERSAVGLCASNRKSADIITIDEENTLWQMGLLGTDNPKKLLNTVLYLTALKTLPNQLSISPQWLIINPMVNGLVRYQLVTIHYYQFIIKQMCAYAGFQGNRSNHSLWATTATRLFRARVYEQLICEQTGHRSNVVRLYKRTSDEQLAEMSDAIKAQQWRKLYLPRQFLFCLRF